MTYATITHLEKLKYTHLYKLDTTFQNIYVSYEPPPPRFSSPHLDSFPILHY